MVEIAKLVETVEFWFYNMYIVHTKSILYHPAIHL